MPKLTKRNPLNLCLATQTEMEYFSLLEINWCCITDYSFNTCPNAHICSSEVLTGCCTAFITSTVKQQQSFLLRACLYSHSARGKVPRDTHTHKGKFIWRRWLSRCTYDTIILNVKNLTCQTLFSLSADNPPLEVWPGVWKGGKKVDWIQQQWMKQNNKQHE